MSDLADATEADLEATVERDLVFLQRAL